MSADHNTLDEQYESLGQAESYDKDLLALVAAARAALADIVAPPGQPVWPSAVALRAALEQFEPWLEVEETPQQMGWVDSKGRP
jgi:hypothetical protein